ncbi:S8 family serine peptidase [Nocardioides sp. cx-173]|uniref:S8 family serine peptidase n=1 Tax=Nocardioides sp. cx-173 TaxID=2898796 RepID=UPI001E505162|nr:S8 family serine peptidase [Nocardioides sp. cx-173]MCD4525628.1 S8 family serine peptidase [Nocardioides sp. cx-173]UGB42769.1 S8 family serine peptidase [Nocardioides sp. cx-173]
MDDITELEQGAPCAEQDDATADARRVWPSFALAATALAGLSAPGRAAPESAEPATALYLVTLVGPGTAGDPDADRLTPATMRARQDRLLRQVGAAEPVYRWTTALNGVAVALTAAQAGALAGDPGVALIERNAVRRLTASAPRPAGPAAAWPAASRRTTGGAGAVIGLVDSGIAPEGPLFARVPQLGRGVGQDWACESGEAAPVCNGKLVSARWYVDGFGAGRVRDASHLSARDDDGHGTQMAAVAAGNAGVDVRVHDLRLERYSGVAPRARLAVYKACWSAPDPADDGCATADVVAAVDQATRDGVDVLGLAVDGPPRIDTVELALLGAAEADIAVVAAAGNDGSAAHRSPWVGGALGERRRGTVVLPGAPDLQGAMIAAGPTSPARLVRGASARTTEASQRQARTCTPGSLDAAAVGGRLVVCERGGVGRVDKSEAVALAGGVGMVLVNVRPGSTDADFHRVPTVHLDRAAGRALLRWLAAHPDSRASLRPAGVIRGPAQVAPWSGAGDAASGLVKPDLVAPAVGVLGAVPPSVTGLRWDFVTGTSAATAAVSGAAAVLRARHGWSAVATRSSLATTAAEVRRTPVTRAGAGLLRPSAAERPGLVHGQDPAAYRAWWEDRRRLLNTPSVVMGRGQRAATRTVTNVGQRTFYFSSSARGFTRRHVWITPAALRLQPGETGTYTVHAAGRGADDGHVVWRGAGGTETRVPVIVR